MSSKVLIQTGEKQRLIDILKSAVAAEIKRLELGLSKTENLIQRFESKYNISSKSFEGERHVQVGKKTRRTEK